MSKDARILEQIEYYKTLFKKNKIAVLAIDNKTLNILDYNEAFANMLQIANEANIIGQNLFNVISFNFAKDNKDEEFLKKYLKKLDNQEDLLFEWQLKKANGEIIDAEIHLMNIKYNEFEFISFIFRDITSYKTNEKLLITINQELRASNEQLVATEEELRQQFEELEMAQKQLRDREEKYRNLVESIDCVIFECDYNGIVTYMSPTIKEMGGYDADEVIGKSNFEYLHPDDRQYVINLFRKVTETKEVFAEDYRLRTKTGEYKWVRSRTRVFWDKDRFIVARGILFDIHEQKVKDEKIKYLSTHDNLTGLKNRGYWEEKLLKLKDKLDILPLSIVVADINGLKEINDKLGQETGDNILVTTAQLISKVVGEKGFVARIGGDEFAILLPNTDEESSNLLIEEIEEESRLLENKNFYLNLSIGTATKHKKEENIYNILLLSEERMYNKKLLQSRSTRSHLVLSLMNVMGEKTHETKEHCQRLAKLSSKVAEKMQLKDFQIEKLKVLATLHDIGKIAVPQYILEKPGKLNEEEWIEMKKHTEIGYRIAKKTPEFSNVAYEILSHHERWDGKGYPQGLKGTEIPLESRILAVVDAFDAMTSDRVYRKAMSINETIAELLKNAGTQFDPFVVDVFVNKVLQEEIEER